MGNSVRAALVTGASSGFGEAIARKLAADGIAVVVAGRDRDRTEAVARSIGDAGGTARPWIGDLRDPQACHAAVAATKDAFSRLDVLVNNAGIIHRCTAEQTTDQQWFDTLATNQSAVFFCSRAAVPIMRSQGGGVIVNIASDWGLVGAQNALAYCATKGAVVQMTRALALDHAREGIRVNAVCPGDCETPMLKQSAAARGVSYDEIVREMGAELPIGRIGTSQDVADLVSFLASEKATFITGAAIAIDGGNTAR